jgi:hypothetical protein
MMIFLKPRDFWKIAVLAIAGMSFACASAHADSIYSFTLTPDHGSGDVGGTLLLTLATPIPLSGSLSAEQGGSISEFDTDITALSITMSDGATFSLNQENGVANASFFDDKLENLSFDDNDFPILPLIGIGGDSYEFSTNSDFIGATDGTITFNGLEVATAPEPSGVVLLGTGLLGVVGAGAVRRRVTS